MTTTIIISISLIFVILGALISALAALGILRLEDVYSRAHAAGKAATLGSIFLLVGVFLFFIGKEGYANMQLIIGILFILITGPLASHLIIKAAYNLETPSSKRLKQDDIPEHLKDKKI
ncbi:Na+/H+ antiporter subunit G1 [Staphylococcus kloosii]|jgi:multicomponent Na+:H+ antiporter subunit G|uniref:Na+/H+ antiporter subunit G1 n=1 Tax=Staphylococcus kloosii TaxID=29384 RepID=UPI000D1D7AE0|nr:Na+/H+ antiporter subunit G1 [Staphylococcus kloosii]PTJ80107.1 Na+/H+ antiporter subunit G1 [Staphylococcus kloosii]